MNGANVRFKRRNAAGWIVNCCRQPGFWSFLFILVITGVTLLVFLLAPAPHPRTFTMPITTTTSGTSTTSTTATTSTTTATTTTTTAAPTSPSAFSISCNASLVSIGDIEYNGPPDFYSLSGTGCGNSNITVTVQSDSILYFKRRNPQRRGYNNNSKRAMMTITSTPSHASVNNVTSVTLDVNQTLTMQQVCDLYNVTIPAATAAMHKKDIFTYPNPAFGYDVPVVGVVQTLNFQAFNDELMAPSDMGPNYYMETNNMGGALVYFASSQDYTTGFGAFFLHGIMQPQCVGGMGAAPTVPVGLRFDNEIGRFVVATLNPSASYICISISSTENPLGSWTNYAIGPDPLNFDYITQTGFEFNVWGDTYNVCNGKTCIVFNKTPMLSALPAEYVVLNRGALFPTQPSPSYPDPPVNAVHQDRGGTRTSFMTNDAPCGVFSTIEAATGTLEVRLCQSINYTDGSTVFQALSMTVTGGSWASSVGLPCDCAQLLSVAKETYSNHVHASYDKRGRMAWAWTSGAGSSTTSIAWAEMDTVTLATGSPTTITRGALVTPPSVAVSGGNYFFSPHLIYDCHGTLWMAMTHATSDDNLIRSYTTYRLRSDPEGVMRSDPVSTSPLVTVYDSTGKGNNWGFPNQVLSTYTGIPRPLHVLQPTDVGSTGARIYMERQTHNITYIAQDACFTTSTCTQTIEIDTSGPCIS